MTTDAFPKHLTIEITEDDARRGNPGSCSTCPTALALQRVLGPGALAEVYLVTADVGWYGVHTESDRWTQYTLPASLRLAISRYDAGGPFATGAYVLTRQDE